MSHFADAREAKEFLISKIASEAEREGVTLSDVERKMLYFSETGWTLPDIMEVNDQFDREYDQAKYEKKIAHLIRNLTKRMRKESPDDLKSFVGAIRKLKKEDHYILVMVEAAGIRTGSVSDETKIGLLFAIGIAFVVALGVLSSYLGLAAPRPNLYFGSYTINEKLSNTAGYLYLSFAALYLCGMAWAHFDPKRGFYRIVDSMLDPIVKGVFRLFGIDEK